MYCVVNCFQKFVCFVFSGGGAGDACLSFLKKRKENGL
nr:MAG TPA: hypothetical protein [Bacteriophage sp.]